MYVCVCTYMYTNICISIFNRVDLGGGGGARHSAIFARRVEKFARLETNEFNKKPRVRLRV